MSILLVLACVALLQDPAPSESKGLSIEHLYAGRGEFMLLGDVVVATVTKVSDPPATNGNPPKVELEIHEILRGDPKIDRTKAAWKPFPHDVDWVGPGAQERLGKWEAQPMASPKAGVKMLLSGRIGFDRKTFDVWSLGRIPFTPEKRDWAAAQIRKHEEIDRREKEESARARKELHEARDAAKK